MKPAFLLVAALLLAGCGRPPPFRAGDILVSARDGSELGRVIEVGPHSFENGASGPSVNLLLPSGKNAWYSVDTTVGTYVVKR